MMHLFVDGGFVSHSGLHLPYKIDCDALTDRDLATIAKAMQPRLANYGSVWGIPRGGVRFAAALREHATWREDDPVLIVDDVLTTGASMEAARARYGRPTIGVVIFSRLQSYPAWIAPFAVVP